MDEYRIGIFVNALLEVYQITHRTLKDTVSGINPEEEARKTSYSWLKTMLIIDPQFSSDSSVYDTIVHEFEKRLPTGN